MAATLFLFRGKGERRVTSLGGARRQLRRRLTANRGYTDPKTVKPRRSQPIQERNMEQWYAPTVPAVSDTTIAPAVDDTIVLVTVSGGFWDMWMNWLIFFERLSIPDLPVHFFPEDEKAREKCLEQAKEYAEKRAAPGDSEYRANVTCLPWDFAFAERSIEQDVGALGYMDVGYKKMMSHRPAIIQRELELGHNLLFSDVDVTWLKDPLPHLRKRYYNSTTGRENHILAQSDGMWLCPGFMLYRSYPETIALVDRWRRDLDGKAKANQHKFNKLVRQGVAEIRAEGLPTNLFVHGRNYFVEFTDHERSMAVVAHNNFIVGYKKKKERMQKFGLWAL